MRWVTRRHIHVNRTATAWLIRRFLDPEGEILFVEHDPDIVARASFLYDSLYAHLRHTDGAGTARA